MLSSSLKVILMLLMAKLKMVRGNQQMRKMVTMQMSNQQVLGHQTRLHSTLTNEVPFHSLNVRFSLLIHLQTIELL